MTRRRMQCDAPRDRCCSNRPTHSAGSPRVGSDVAQGRRTERRTWRRPVDRIEQSSAGACGIRGTADRRSGNRARERRERPQHCARRRVHRHQRGRRSARRRRRVRRIGRRSRGRPRVHRDRERAARNAGRGSGRRSTARLIELDGTPNKARLGGNATSPCRWPRCTRPRRRARSRCGVISPADAEPTLPMPMVQIFGGGAHAGRRVDIQDFLVVPIGASTFDEAISIAVRIYESAAGRIMAERGGLRGVADEGGWWPEFSSNSDALDALLLAIERAGLRPGIDAAIAIDVAASQLRSGSRYRFAAENREMTQRRARRHPLRSGAAAIPSSRSRIRSPRTMTRACARLPRVPAATCR